MLSLFITIKKYYYSSNSGKTRYEEIHIEITDEITGCAAQKLFAKQPTSRPKDEPPRKQYKLIENAEYNGGNSALDKFIDKLIPELSGRIRYKLHQENENIKLKSREEFLESVNISIHAFEKKHNKVSYIGHFSGEGKKVKNNLFESGQSRIWDAVVDEKHSKTTQEGCIFIIDDDNKALRFIKDNDWINRVKDEAKRLFPKANKEHPELLAFFIDAQRHYKAGKSKSFEKCVNKIKKYYGDYQFIAIKV